MKTKHVQYETWGTCSKMIDVIADENDVIQQVFFTERIKKAQEFGSLKTTHKLG